MKLNYDITCTVIDIKKVYQLREFVIQMQVET